MYSSDRRDRNSAYINCAEMVISYFPRHNYLNSGPLQRPIVNGVWNIVFILSASKIYKHVYQVSDLGMKRLKGALRPSAWDQFCAVIYAFKCKRTEFIKIGINEDGGPFTYRCFFFFVKPIRKSISTTRCTLPSGTKKMVHSLQCKMPVIQEILRVLLIFFLGFPLAILASSYYLLHV